MTRVRAAIVATMLLAGCTVAPNRDRAAAAQPQPTTREIRKVELNDLAVWRYDAAADKWTPVRGDVVRRVLFEPIGRTESATTRPLQADPIGLYWVSWLQDDVRRGTLIFRGPVQCNDVNLGDPPPGKIAACVPSENSATAQFVPDPRLSCK